MRDYLINMRKDSGQTCKEVGEKLGITESYYLMIEQGKRQQNMDITLVVKLADVFNTSISAIVSSELSWKGIVC